MTKVMIHRRADFLCPEAGLAECVYALSLHKTGPLRRRLLNQRKESARFSFRGRNILFTGFAQAGIIAAVEHPSCNKSAFKHSQ